MTEPRGPGTEPDPPGQVGVEPESPVPAPLDFGLPTQEQLGSAESLWPSARAGGLPLFLSPTTSRPRSCQQNTLQWRVRIQLRVLWAHCRALVRNRYDSAFIVLVVVLNALLATAQCIYQSVAPLPEGCPTRGFFYRAGVPRGCESFFHVSMILISIRMALAVMCLGGIWSQRVLHIQTIVKPRNKGVGRLTRGGTLVRKLSEPKQKADSSLSECPRLSDVRIWGSGGMGWAVASSKQTWLETTSAMYSSVVFFLGTSLAITVLLTLINLVTALTDTGWTSGASWDYACRTCSDSPSDGLTPREVVVAACMERGHAPLNLCFFSWHARVALPILTSGQLLSLGIVTAFTILAAWDPIAVKASHKLGQQWVDRWRVTHIVMVPSMAFFPFPFIAVQSMELYKAPRGMVEGFGISSILFSVFHMCMCVWVLMKGKHSRLDDDTPLQTRLSVTQYIFSLPSVIYDAFLKDSVSLHHKRMFMLVLFIYTSSSCSGISYGTAYAVTIAILRFAFAAFFVLCSDTATDFSDLRRDPNGAGFGLLVDACMLQQALQRYLDNSTPLHCLPTYKATVYRMEAAMAVSYRWQGREAYICPGLKLNMSRWQMEQLVKALGNTSCFYVWIDRLSVPQYESELQNTLLSRMMGTFANARETLVLRSMEKDGSRYHQRAWTLPEFICTPSPRICTEELKHEPGVTWADGPASATTAEEEVVADVREHYLSCVGQVCPLWLHPEGKVEFGSEVQADWDRYARIRGYLNCAISEDRIRAVYPLLFCVPVENHAELESLVDSVASALEKTSPGSRAAIRARRHYDEIVGAAVVDPDEPVDHSEGGQPRGLIGSAFSHLAGAWFAGSARAMSSVGSAFASARANVFRRVTSSNRTAPIGVFNNRTYSGDSRLWQLPTVVSVVPPKSELTILPSAATE